ncbi:acetyltransferase [Marinifilum fragile]|uniref:acetyltransferase n=1 Tax=Marinifilum fragile TaxID=570161 RepID=UPI002AA91153|nr:acetyltransferase [Marinifilum fragile]
MKNIAIFGAGGFGREVACHIHRINRECLTWNIIGYFDDGVEKGTKISTYGEVLGGLKELNHWNEDLSVVVAIGDPNTMKKIVEKITNPLLKFPNIIAPGIRFNNIDTFNIGKGNIIVSGSAFSCDVSMGDFNIYNGSVVLGHDVKLGSFNTFMGAVRISGDVKIGDLNFFGVGSIVIQGVKIGNKVRLGAGSVLMRKTKDGYLYIGNPAKKYDLG